MRKTWLTVPLICCTLALSIKPVEAPNVDIIIQQQNTMLDIQRIAENQALLETKLMKQKQELATSRGIVEARRKSMCVTAYTLRLSECGKTPDHPEYGITASGEQVQEWYTIAAPPSIPFGTKIYIPYFKDKPNGGIFVVKDRGAAIKEGRLDIYMEDLQEALAFGKRQLNITILGE